MIEEAGIVMAIEADGVWVATQRKTTCGSCSARMTCGHGLLTSLASDKKPHLIKVHTDFALCEGDPVMLGISESLLVRSAFLVYMLPLLVMFIGALTAQALDVSEPWIILTAALGFFAGALWVRRYSDRYIDSAAIQPVLACAQIADSPALEV
ncbi:MAG: SoxR reducing system RseC family protein [Pseudomonas sp.]|jgi:sigma-E factor negative regulatory protein RseC|nr:SoxR reducing system RseC family protein [Pseudomonas sp.]